MPDQKSLKILVAEDDELIAELLCDILDGMGHTVCAVTACEAGTVVAAHQFQPDLLIVDFRLSPGSGVNAVDLIMQTRFIPHILVSGSMAQLRTLRPDAILLQKPYTCAALGMAIARTNEHA